MKQVTAGVYTFTGLNVGRVYLLEDDDGLTLIDTGLGSAPAKITQQLQAQGRQLNQIKRILITHAHPDHVAGLPEMKRLTGAEVITSAIERPFVEGKLPVPVAPKESLSGLSRLMWRPPAPVKGTPVDREVQDGDVITKVLGGLQVVATPGHSPGHIAFWQPERRILFCGDVIVRFLRLGLPIASFTPDMAENIRSIGRVAELDAEIICFGHGSPLTQNTASMVRNFARKIGAG